ncbi:SHOCT domain-containing protein [Cellulomonas hominis]
MRRRAGRPGLLGTMARTAVITKTAQAVTAGSQRPPAPPAHQPLAAPVAPAGATPADRIAQLQALADLRSQGILTDAEFETEKARILAS